jgi:hypothetical protein
MPPGSHPLSELVPVEPDLQTAIMDRGAGVRHVCRLISDLRHRAVLNSFSEGTEPALVIGRGGEETSPLP